MTAPKCGKCLLSEFDIDFFADTIADCISRIPEEKRTSEAEYKRRLGICLDCPSLMDGMCGECGCFAELRAAKAWLGCPICRWSGVITRD